MTAYLVYFAAGGSGSSLILATGSLLWGFFAPLDRRLAFLLLQR